MAFHRLLSTAGNYKPFVFVILILLSSWAGAADFAVYGEIGKKYAQLGGPAGSLGQPLSSEAGFPGGGRFNNFQNGSIYWHHKTGAHVVLGAIKAKWLEPPATGPGFLGYPTTDETVTPDRRGRFNHFRRTDNGAEASIYWTPTTGAIEIYGDIRKKWAAMGWERSSLGYPTAVEYQEYQGTPIRRQMFERGSLFWSPKTGVTLESPIRAYDPPPRNGNGNGSGNGSGSGVPTPPTVRYCTDMSCSACKRDGLKCTLSSQCTNMNAQWACHD